MVSTRSSARKKLKLVEDDNDSVQEEVANNNNNEAPEEAEAVEEQETARKNWRKSKKNREKQRKEELKSKTTGIGLKISVDDSAPPTNRKIVFDDTNLPASDADSDDDAKDPEDSKSETPVTKNEEEEDDDDDDAVEEVKGSAARDKVMDQMKTEAKQSLKSKKKRNRKVRPEKKKKKAPATKEYGSDGEDMDDDFFAQLDSVREREAAEEKKELELSKKRGKHTTFVFAQNKNDEVAPSEPVFIDDNLQVVVLNNPSTQTTAPTAPLFTGSSISKTALSFSRNRLKDGTDPGAGRTEEKRKRKRSGEEVQPWKRAARARLSMGRSRMTKGKPAAFFTKKKKR